MHETYYWFLILTRLISGAVEQAHFGSRAAKIWSQRAIMSKMRFMRFSGESSERSNLWGDDWETEAFLYWHGGRRQRARGRAPAKISWPNRLIHEKIYSLLRNYSKMIISFRKNINLSLNNRKIFWF